MCTTIYVDGRELETVGELRKWLGSDPAFRAGYPSCIPHHACLCCVDVAATARKAGCRLESNEFDEHALTRLSGKGG